MLILDLDDTIFKTSTMDPKIFDSAIDVVRQFYHRTDAQISERITKELWENPIDEVFDIHGTPDRVKEEFYIKISEVDYSKLDIKTFEDYSAFKEINIERILVTTGLKELQNAKIDALGIRNDFKQIFIDDPRRKPRMDKFQIFLQILKSSNLKADQVWVIGDNPESEIKAASELGIKTIQRSSNSKFQSDTVDYYINTFYELAELLNQTSK